MKIHILIDLQDEPLPANEHEYTILNKYTCKYHSV